MTVIEEQLTGVVMDEMPREGLRRAMFRAPLYVWRLGLGWLLPPSFACMTTRGRKSGLPRYAMIEHNQIGHQIYLVSGWQGKPQWVKNLTVDPTVTIQPVRGQPVTGTAQRVQDDETLRTVFAHMQESPMWRPWLESLDIKPNVEDFIANKARVYLFQITPQPVENLADPLPPLAQDLRWVTQLVASTIILSIFNPARFLRKRKQ